MKEHFDNRVKYVHITSDIVAITSKKITHNVRIFLQNRFACSRVSLEEKKKKRED